MAVEVLSSLRHECTACGGSCQGSHAYLLNQGEVDTVLKQAAELGVANPIEDGHLTQVKGRCAFLDADNLCRIHREYGFESKPLVCKQYPMVALRTETGLRAGVDPGCYSVMATQHTADEVSNENLVAHRMDLPNEQELKMEQAFLDRTDVEGMTVAAALFLVTGKPADHTGLPAGFAKRLIVALQKSGLGLLVELPDTPPKMRAALAPVTDAFDSWDPDNPPPWPCLDAEAEAYAVDVVRRMVHLRLASQSVPVVAGVALLTLSGIIAAAWANPEHDALSKAVPAWCRAIRVRPFWMSICPDGAALQHLATG